MTDYNDDEDDYTGEDDDDGDDDPISISIHTCWFRNNFWSEISIDSWC